MDNECRLSLYVLLTIKPAARAMEGGVVERIITKIFTLVTIFIVGWREFCQSKNFRNSPVR
jgi:hypothetical protein